MRCTPLFGWNNGIGIRVLRSLVVSFSSTLSCTVLDRLDFDDIVV